MEFITKQCVECGVIKFIRKFKLDGCVISNMCRPCAENPEQIAERKERKIFTRKALLKYCRVCDTLKFENEFYKSSTALLYIVCSREHIHNKYPEIILNAKRRKKYVEAAKTARVEATKAAKTARVEAAKRREKYKEDNKEKLTLQVNAQQILYKRQKSKSQVLFDQIPPDAEARFNPKGYIEVKCKLCGKYMTPTNNQIYARIKAFKNTVYGEHYFYCSQNCKDTCPLYGYSPMYRDPRLPQPDIDPRSCQSKALKQLQCDEYGYNYCERCGDIVDVELHHTQPVANDPNNSVNGAGHLLLCAGCHVALHAECV